MGLHETEAIILRTYNLAEADKIVVCLTRNSGVVRAVARGAKRLKSRFGAVLEALAQSPEQLQTLVHYFDLWILKLSGFLPDLRSCAECGRKFEGDSPG